MIEVNRRGWRLLAGSALLVLAGAFAHDAAAQELRRGESVFERARPDFDPLGVRAGSFVIFPRAELSEAYNDNIFADDNGEEDDFITVVSPQLEVQSDWGRHALNLEARADAGFFADNTDENFLDGLVAADGRLDVLRETFLVGGLGFRHLHEDRGSPDDVEGEEPTEYDIYSASLGAVRARGIISARLDGNFDRFDFHDVDAAGGDIDQDDRDRNEYRLTARGGYEYLPETEAFIQLSTRWRDYDELEGGFDRDSIGYAAVVGTDLDFTGKTSGEVYAGYQFTDYDDDDLESLDGIAAGAAVLWNVTGLTSVRGRLDVTTEETTQGGASGYLALRTGVEVEHELRRNILVGALLTYGNDNYKGINRDDDIFRGSLNARYLINRNFYAGGELTHRTRVSHGTGDDFSQNIVLVRLGAQL